MRVELQRKEEQELEEAMRLSLAEAEAGPSCDDLRGLRGTAGTSRASTQSYPSMRLVSTPPRPAPQSYAGPSYTLNPVEHRRSMNDMRRPPDRRNNAFNAMSISGPATPNNNNNIMDDDDGKLQSRACAAAYADRRRRRTATKQKPIPLPDQSAAPHLHPSRSFHPSILLGNHCRHPPVTCDTMHPLARHHLIFVSHLNNLPSPLPRPLAMGEDPLDMLRTCDTVFLGELVVIMMVYADPRSGRQRIDEW